MAEELTQETFYRAIKSANGYDGTCKVSTWLCQIAKHLWHQELDKRRRKSTSMPDENKDDEQIFISFQYRNFIL